MEVIETPDVPYTTANPRVAVMRPDRTGELKAETLGAVGGELVKGIQKGRARSLSSSPAVQSIEAINALSDAGIGFTDDGEIDISTVAPGDEDLAYRAAQVKEKSQGMFKKLASKFKQQGIEEASAAAKVQIEKELRTLMMQTPGFEDEIHRSARQVLGFEPLGFTTGSILGRRDPAGGGSGRLTPLQKFAEEVELFQVQMQAAGIDMTYDQAFKTMSRIRKDEVNLQVLQTQVDTGQIQGDRAMMEELGSWDGMQSLWKSFSLKVISGELSNPKDKAAALGLVDRMISEKERQLIKTLGGEGATSVPTMVKERLENEAKRMKDFINNTSMLTILGENMQLLDLMAKETAWTIDPELMTITAGFGDKTAALILEQLFTAEGGNNFKLLVEQYPLLKRLYGEDGTMDFKTLHGAVNDLLLNGSVNISNDPETNADATEAVAGMLIDGAKGDPEKLDLIDKALSAADPKLSVNAALSHPNYYNSLSDKGKKRLKENWGASLMQSVDNVAQKLANEGGELTFSQKNRGDLVFFRESYAAGEYDNPRRTESIVETTDTNTRDVEWLSFATKQLSTISSGTAAMKKDFFGSKDFTNPRGMVVDMVNIKAATYKYTAANAELAKYEAMAANPDESAPRVKLAQDKVEELSKRVDFLEKDLNVKRIEFRNSYRDTVNFLDQVDGAQ
jgi:hypothetical protein